MTLRNKPTADLIFVGATVITMEDPIEARPLDLAVSGERILAVCEPSDSHKFRGEGTKIIDVGGKTLMPGLIDSHNHMVLYGKNLQAVDVSSPRVKSIEELCAKLNERASQTAPGEWIFAWGYDDTRLAEKRHPTREDLDRACPNNPVSLMRTCMHVMAVNSAALKVAGISAATSNPSGGEIGRGENGEPNGLLYELGAMNMINRQLPVPNPEDCARSIALASEVYASQGLTSLTEAGAGWSGNPNETAGFQIAYQSGTLRQRVFLGLMEETHTLTPEHGGTGLFTGFGNDYLKIGPAKFVADGGIGARTAAMKEAYEGSREKGVLCEDPESLTRRMEALHRAGYQISVHAIGDHAIDVVLTAFESILSRYPRAHRHRLEHAAVCRPGFIERLRKLNLVVVVQPAFLHYLGDSFISNLGSQRVRHTIPLRTMLANNIPLAGSSDRPVTDGNPWKGIWSAVNRQTISGQPIVPEERLTTAEALKIYTRGGAFACLSENDAGTLSAGKWADIAVLDSNPLSLPPSELMNVETEMTFVGGKEIYRKPS